MVSYITDLKFFSVGYCELVIILEMSNVLLVWLLSSVVLHSYSR